MSPTWGENKATFVDVKFPIGYWLNIQAHSVCIWCVTITEKWLKLKLARADQGPLHYKIRTFESEPSKHKGFFVLCPKAPLFLVTVCSSAVEPERLYNNV